MSIGSHFVGTNTPVIIKYPFWKMTAQNPDAVYVCLNLGKTFVPREIAERSTCVDNDIGVPEELFITMNEQI